MDHSTYLPDVSRSGAIYKVTFTDKNSFSMKEILVDNKNGSDSATLNSTSLSFNHGRDDQWLGVSIDVKSNKGILTCAHRWYNRYNSESPFMNGMCYELPLDFNSNNVRKIPALINAVKQTETVGPDKEIKYNYGMGGLGASVHYTQGQDILMGAPGLQSWTGGFVDQRQTNLYITHYQEAPTEDSEMAGYAMSSGDYFKYGTIYFAMGAPRDKLTGRVYLYSSKRTAFLFDNADLVLNGSEAEGAEQIPMNAFFGASLCTVDVNGDGYEDLMVGAPMFSPPRGRGHDEGAVFVYLGRDLTKFEQMTTPLTGSKAPGSRFGTAIGSLGDINADSFNDIIIGAPYEDGGHGAVYVYNGCEKGVWPQYTQRIGAEKLRSGLTSFGISFSKPEDMNADGVKDIAIGAYLSDTVFLLHGLPVINMDFSLVSRVAVIDKDGVTTCMSQSRGVQMRCFSLDVCFQYFLRAVPFIDVDITMALDTYMGEYYRLEFETNGMNTLKFNGRVFHGDKACIPQNVIIRSTADLVTPVRIYTNYTDQRPTGSELRPIVSQFNGANPDTNLQSDSVTLEFKKACPDNICNTDLTLNVIPEFQAYQDKFYVLGTNNNLTFDVQISKAGDPSYGSNIFFSFRKSIQFQKVVKVYGDTEISCGFVEEDGLALLDKDGNSPLAQYKLQIPPREEDEKMLVCSFGNPMMNNTGVRFKLVTRVPDTITEHKLNFKFNTTTLSQELVPADNVHSVSIPVRNKVSTSFSGVSQPSFITVRDKKTTYKTTHVYELRNKGPSLLPEARITVQYPEVISGGFPHIRLNTTKWSCGGPCKVTCRFPDEISFKASVNAMDSGPTYYLSESKEEGAEPASDKKRFDCTKGSCPRYECQLTNIPPREGAVVTLDFIIHGNILDDISDGDAIAIRSDAYIRFEESSRLITESERHVTDVLTDILPETPPKKPLAWWIILVSIIAGILLIVIVGLLLWKCGFFKRQKREDMLKMQKTGEVEKMLDPDEPNGLNTKE